jgi:hypothetical protein
MRNGNGATQQPPAPPEPQREITAEDVHRQQRANLALRALDLEAENVLLQQEVERLRARLAELEMVADRGMTIDARPNA